MLLQGHNKSCLSPRVAGSSRPAVKSKRALDEEDTEQMETEATPAAAAAHMCNGDANKRSRPDQEGDASQPQTNGMFVFFCVKCAHKYVEHCFPLHGFQF